MCSNTTDGSAQPDELDLMKAEVLRVLNTDGATAADWSDMSALLGREESVTVKGETFTALACAVRAVELDDSTPAIWSNVVGCMVPGERVVIAGVEYTALGAALKALRMDITAWHVWHTIGYALLGEDKTFRLPNDSHIYTKADCFANAIRYHPGQDDRTLEDPKHALAAAWILLAVHTPDPHRPIPVRPGNSEAPVMVTRLQCALQSVELVPSPDGFYFVSMFMSGDERVAIGGASMGRVECLHRALDLHPEHAPALLELSKLHAANNAYTDALAAAQRAVAADVAMAAGWHHLGVLLMCDTDARTVKLGSLEVTAVEALRRAAMYNPQHMESWQKLAIAMRTAKLDEVRVGDKTMTLGEVCAVDPMNGAVPNTMAGAPPPQS